MIAAATTRLAAMALCVVACCAATTLAQSSLSGTIQPAEKLQAVVAIEPSEVKTYQASVDTETGRFVFNDLPPGEYDLIVKVVGHVYEGVTLDPDPEQQSTLADAKRILEEIKPTFFESEDYFHLKKIVRMTGNGPQARMFVVQTRTRHTVDPSGAKINAIIRRFDFVDMLKTHKAWQIVASRHLLRQEVPYGSPDTDIKFTFSPALGSILLGDGGRDVGVIDLNKLPKGDAGRYATADYVGP